MPSQLAEGFRQSFIRMSPPVKLLLVVFIIAVFLVLSSVLALLVAMPLYHLGISEIYHIFSEPDAENIGVIKFFQIIESVFLFLVPGLLVAWLFSERIAAYLKANVKPSGITLLLVAGSLIVAIPTMNSLALFNSALDLPEWMNSIENKIRSMEDNAGRLTELFLAGENGIDLMVNMMMIALLPALGEEILFRGILQRLFSEWTKNPHLGVWISAFLFSFIHFQFYGFLPRLLLGLYFGYLLLWSSAIWVPIVGHFVNNGFAVVYYHFSREPMGETTMDKLGTSPENYFILSLSVFFTIILVGIIFLHEKARRSYPGSYAGGLSGSDSPFR